MTNSPPGRSVADVPTVAAPTTQRRAEVLRLLVQPVLVLLLTPIFVPIVTHIGFDPVHFGILMMSLVPMGSMTPPVGVAMFTVCGLLKCPTHEYVLESLPFAVTILGVVAILVFIPEVVLFLPRVLM